MGSEGTRQLVDEVSERAARRLEVLASDTSVLLDLIAALTFRTG